MDSFSANISQALTGGYTIERELGGGGMSRTYLAREHALSRRVVVKVLSPDLLQGLSVERFKREVLVAAQRLGELHDKQGNAAKAKAKLTPG